QMPMQPVVARAACQIDDARIGERALAGLVRLNERHREKSGAAPAQQVKLGIAIDDVDGVAALDETDVGRRWALLNGKTALAKLDSHFRMIPRPGQPRIDALETNDGIRDAA